MGWTDKNDYKSLLLLFFPFLRKKHYFDYYTCIIVQDVLLPFSCE